MSALKRLRSWVKTGDSGAALLARSAIRGARTFHLPGARGWGALLWAARAVVRPAWLWSKKILYSEPLVRYRCHVAGRLILEGEPPLIAGAGTIRLGDGIRLGRRLSFAVGTQTGSGAELIVGPRTSVNFDTVISAEKRVTIGSDCQIAGRVKIFDNNNHPLDPDRRHEPVALEDCGPVTLEDKVWVGQDATILKGVTVGYGSVVAASAVVTRDVPPLCVAAGNPARVVKQIRPAGPSTVAPRGDPAATDAGASS